MEKYYRVDSKILLRKKMKRTGITGILPSLELTKEGSQYLKKNYLRN